MGNKHDKPEEKLVAKTFSILGDSISTFDGCNPVGFDVFYSDERLAKTGVTHAQQTWWHLLIDHFGGTLLKNGSFSGSLVEGGFFPAGDSDTRADAILGDNGETPDVIVCFIGINDYGWGGAKMNADGHGSATPAEWAAKAPAEKVIAKLAAPGQLERFATAYASMLARLRKRCPEAEIWCVTLVPGRIQGNEKPQFVYDFRGVPFAGYNDAIRSCARTANAHVADAFACGMDYEAIEGTHPTARGMRQLAGMFAWSMEHEANIDATLGIGARGLSTMPQNALPAELLSEWDNPAIWRSEPLCADKPCTFCKRAMAPNNAWLLMCDNQ